MLSDLIAVGNDIRETMKAFTNTSDNFGVTLNKLDDALNMVIDCRNRSDWIRTARTDYAIDALINQFKESISVIREEAENLDRGYSNQLKGKMRKNKKVRDNPKAKRVEE